MAAKRRAPAFKKVSRPKPQTLDTPGQVSLHKVRASPRFSFNTGDRITEGLAVIGHLYVGDAEVQQAIRAIIHVSAAVDHLHSHGYVHRDIKPANIIVRGGIPILIDLGSAFKLQPHKKPARAVGTDPYMAPEQCLKEELSERTDVYQLGAVLYEMLTGRWPYEDQLMNKQSDGLEGRFPQITKNQPPGVRKFNASVSPGLERLILKTLAKEPGKRVPSVRELVRELAAYLEKEEQLWPESLNYKSEMV